MGRHSLPNDATREFALPYQPRHATETDWEWIIPLDRYDDEPTTVDLMMPGKVTKKEKWTLRLATGGLLLLLLLAMIVSSLI